MGKFLENKRANRESKPEDMKKSFFLTFLNFLGPCGPLPLGIVTHLVLLFESGIFNKEWGLKSSITWGIFYKNWFLGPFY